MSQSAADASVAAVRKESVADEHFFFEGVEKVLEIDFVPGECSSPRGLRALTRTQLDELCTAARCTIIATMSNDHLDSYVLSESSLFVYSYKMILKTCGTTTLLMALEPLLRMTGELGMKVEWVAYTRKDFQRPGQQKFPHRDHVEESAYLKQFFPEGHTFILGPVTADHWVVFVSDYLDRHTDADVDRTLDMMMFGIDESVAKLFVKDAERFPKDSDVTRASGIDTLLPGSQIQEFCFDPCGYSMNGLLYDSYWTIHITPEASFSYASFETNIRMSSYAGLIKAVLAIFKPRKWTMTLFADNGGLKGLRENPFSTLLTVPVVQSTSRAIMGPCVVTKDAYGHAFVTYTGGAAGGAGAGGSGKAAGGSGSATPGSGSGGPASSPKAAGPSEAESFAIAAAAAAAIAAVAAADAASAAGIEPAAAAAAADVKPSLTVVTVPAGDAVPVAAGAAAALNMAAGVSAGAPLLSPTSGEVAPVEVLAAALIAGAGGEGEGATGGAGAAAAAPVVSAASAGGAGAGVAAAPPLRTVTSRGHLAGLAKGSGSGAATPSPSGAGSSRSGSSMPAPTAAVSYVMTTKSQTEFVGEYSALFGIFNLVLAGAHGPTAVCATAAAAASGSAGAGSGMPGVADAASETLSLPRAKYVVAKRLEELNNARRQRADSV